MVNQAPPQPAARAPFPLTVEQLRMIIGGIAVLMALLMFFGFFTASWMEDEDTKGSEGKVTGWELFTGNNGDQDVKFGDNGDSVRGIDRMLIFLPLLALALGAVGFFYGFGHLLNLPLNLAPIMVAAGVAILAFVLFIFPFMWQSMSDSNFRSQIKDSAGDFYSDSDIDKLVDELNDAYSTGQQIFFGFLALLAGVAAVALELPQVRQMLGLPMDAPRPVGPGGYAPPPYTPQA